MFKREAFEEYCLNTNVTEPEEYSQGLKRIEDRFQVSLDVEFENDKCDNVLTLMNDIIANSTDELKKNAYIDEHSHLATFISYKKSLINFDEAMKIVERELSKINCSVSEYNYDAVIAKSLPRTCLLRDAGQTHIAITGETKNMFPYVVCEGYFTDQYSDANTDLKSFFTGVVPCCLFKANCDYLEAEINKEFEDGILTTRMSIVKGRRNEQESQIEISHTLLDGPEFVEFRKAFKENDYLVILKIANEFKYHVFGFKAGNPNLDAVVNRFFYKKSRLNTPVELDTFIVKNPCFSHEQTNLDSFDFNSNTEFICERKQKQITFKHNRVFFGAPGTGKSYKINKSVLDILKADKNGNPTRGNYIRVTFHQDYSYAQFVGTYKPTMNGNAIEYNYVPGPFMRILAMAYKNILSAPKDEEGKFVKGSIEPFVLIIEEINRAKAAAVFGDMFQLLDRDDDGVSEYDMQPSREVKEWLASECGVSLELFNSIRIPDNMFIWASMNSADQGVFPMDTAMKRRWEFEYVGINNGEFLTDEKGDSIRDEKGDKKESQGGSFKIAGEKEGIEWNVLRRAINDKLMSDDIKAHEDKLMGPFFIKTMDKKGNLLPGFEIHEDSDEDSDKFINLFCEKVLMYLFEDAAKTKRPQLFSGVKPDKINSYSYICEQFKGNIKADNEKPGIGIFGEDFKNKYYEEAKNERDKEKKK